MYKQSDDLRFIKSKQALRRAFIDLTLEKQTPQITVRDLAQRAGVNRMTFYAHYDEVPDILLELLDEMSVQILEARQDAPAFGVDALLTCATSLMQEEMEFYRLVAQDDRFELYRAQFRKSFTAIFTEELKATTSLSGAQLNLTASLIASGITYAYLDWLAGDYPDLSLEELVALCEQFVSRQIET